MGIERRSRRHGAAFHSSRPLLSLPPAADCAGEESFVSIYDPILRECFGALEPELRKGQAFGSVNQE